MEASEHDFKVGVWLDLVEDFGVGVVPDFELTYLTYLVRQDCQRQRTPEEEREGCERRGVGKHPTRIFFLPKTKSESASDNILI